MGTLQVMYEHALTLHSALRIALLVMVGWMLSSSARGLVAGKPRPPRARLMQRVSVIVADLQLATGLLLYFVWSPSTAFAMSDFGAAMKDGGLRYWAIEHGTMMLLTIVLLHAGKILARRAPDDRSFHRRTLIFFGLALVGVLVGSPGLPWAEHGRGFLRL